MSFNGTDEVGSLMMVENDGRNLEAGDRGTRDAMLLTRTALNSSTNRLHLK